MCGIFGIIGSNENIEKSINSLSHRGPDDKGIYSDESIILGFRRLNIIDLSLNGHQPMSNETGKIWIVFNGEIYNFKKIKKILQEKKHKFISNTDTEVLLHGYEEWGINGLLKRINGMFALCLYDKNRQTCFLARDRIGEKPLYLYQNGKETAFSSEIKAFFKLKHFDFSIDQKTLETLFGFPYLPYNDKTIIKNISKVEPGSYLKINIKTKKIETVVYYSFDESKHKNINFSEACDQTEKLLISSVVERLSADVPVGVLLSGGLDSSLITAIASRYSEKKIKTITISYPGSCIDETKYAQTVANYCHTDHTNLRLNVQDSYKELKENIWIYDDLSTVDSGLLSTYLMCREIRKLGIKVVLTGEGADEIFGGYSWHWLNKFPFNFFPDSIKTKLYYYSIMRIISNKQFSMFPQELHSFLTNNKGGYFKKIQKYEIQHSLPNHYCMKLDKGASAASVETRPPFMDHKVVENALDYPEKYFLKFDLFDKKKFTNKLILRKIAQKYLPEKIYSRKKKGGMLPVYEIILEGIKKDSSLILKNSTLTDFFGKKYLYNLIVDEPKLKLYIWQREWILWKCLVFSLWNDYYKNYGKSKF